MWKRWRVEGGEVLRQLVLDPARDYQRRSAWCLRCLDTWQWRSSASRAGWRDRRGVRGSCFLRDVLVKVVRSAAKDKIAYDHSGRYAAFGFW